MKLPPWFPLATIVTCAFLLTITGWIIVFKLAKEVNIQPFDESNDKNQSATNNSQ